LHILSHGRSGALYLGATELTTASLGVYATLLAQIGSRLSADGDILLYGCDVAFGTDGQAFITRFAALTGADVAASSDKTGSADVKGNWNLEAVIGEVETAAALFSVSGVSLDVFTGASGNDQLVGTSGTDTLIGNAGNDTINGGDGEDIAVFSGNYADYQFTPLVNGVLVKGPDGQDVVVNVEKLQFADQTVGFLALGAAETRVNTYVTDTQMQSKTITLADGSRVVIWSSANQDGSGWGVFGQLYGEDGTPKGGEFMVNTRVGGDQTQPGRPAQIVALKEGGFAVVWDEWGSNGAEGQPTSWNIRGQIFDASAKKVGNEFFAAKDSGFELAPAVTQLVNGNLVVTWQSEDGSGDGIFGQVLTPSGSIVGNKFAINTNTSGGQNAVEITALADGGWLAVWSSGHNGRIQGQRYDAAGAASGAEFQLSGNWSSGSPSLVALADGGWLVTYQTWYGAGDQQNGVFYSRYNSTGVLVGEHVLVNSRTESDQYEPSASALKDGG